jgi:Domain of unknown function (DUF1707)
MTPAVEDDSGGPSHPADADQPTRASNADRFATTRILQDAVSQGLLTPDEGSERIAVALAAVYRHDLDSLVADLPAVGARGRAPGWRALGTMTVEQVRSSLSMPNASRLSPARIAITVLVVALLLLLVGYVVAELFFDGRGGRGPGGFDRR